MALAALLLPWARAGALPSVVSLNVCADQLVLALADETQILSVSWLAADPEESMMAGAAQRFPLNYGSAEEVLHHDPDVVIAGVYTAAYTTRVLSDVGYTVVSLPPAETIEQIEDNVRRVAAAIGQAERGAAAIETLQQRIARLRAARSPQTVEAVLVRPGGFTVGADSLTHRWMGLAGLVNVAAQQGLDRWGSLSMETLLRTTPDLLVLTGYHGGAPSLANAALSHPALAALEDRVPTVTVPAALLACGTPRSVWAAELMHQAARRLAP